MIVDVAVVGGGPSGSITALELVRLGYSVALIERAQFPRRKVCGEYLNCGTLGQLEELGLLNLLQPLLNPLRKVKLATAGAQITLRFPRLAGGLARATLDAALLDAAKTAGVHVVQARVVGLHIQDHRVRGVTIKQDDRLSTITARFTVGADGCGSVVARELQLTQRVKGNFRYALGGHFRHEQSDTLLMSVERSTYLASNPLQEGRANIMLVAPRSQMSASAGQPDRWFTATANTLKLNDKCFDAQERIGDRVAVGPLVHRVSSSVAPGALLVGDAGGFVSPFTGQGLYIALASARAAAKTIDMIFSNPFIETKALDSFQRDQADDRRRRSRLSDFLGALAHMPKLAKRVMQRLELRDQTRDELIAMFCGLQAPSIRRGAELLIPLTL